MLLPIVKCNPQLIQQMTMKVGRTTNHSRVVDTGSHEKGRRGLCSMHTKNVLVDLGQFRGHFKSSVKK